MGRTVTSKAPELLNQPNPSALPRNCRVAPVATSLTCNAPPAVIPSPTKKTCLCSGESVRKSRLAEDEKSGVAGAGAPSGWLASGKTPTSGLVGRFIPHLAFSAPLVAPTLANPSGPWPAGAGSGTKFAAPVTEKDSPTIVGLPRAKSTGDGATSPQEAVIPSGMPASLGFALPGTVRAWALPPARRAKASAAAAAAAAGRRNGILDTDWLRRRNAAGCRKPRHAKTSHSRAAA